MVMRLVRDDEQDVREEIDVKKNDLRKANKEGEEQDGPVQDSAEEAAEEGSAVESDEINLAILEALLFSTTHPLTAGRLGELLDLESTKPIRAAIRALNKQ